MTPEVATYQGEQAVRAYAIKQREDFLFWRDYYRRLTNAESTKPHDREVSANSSSIYSQAIKAMDEVVRLLDETRAARMEAKGLPNL